MKTNEGLNSDIEFCIDREVSTPLKTCMKEKRRIEGRIKTSMGICEQERMKETEEITNYKVLSKSKNIPKFGNLIGATSKLKISQLSRAMKSNSTIKTSFQKNERKKETLKMKIPQFLPFNTSEEKLRSTKVFTKSLYSGKFGGYGKKRKTYNKNMSKLTGADHFHPKNPSSNFTRKSPILASTRLLKKRYSSKTIPKRSKNTFFKARVTFKPAGSPLALKNTHLNPTDCGISKNSTLKPPNNTRQSYLNSLLREHDLCGLAHKALPQGKPLVHLFHNLNVIRAKSTHRPKVLEKKRRTRNQRNHTGIFEVWGWSCEKRTLE
ncbi:unnamed protein product [Moneuplotes crassus]|uniref:Uncharacterized protein n=1 Tax=Euplotes crassus TaxID=5936 RepID=A0AAD1XAR5_EUPCR|nr:unnamed protein product [Moneuplotes crassus]